MSFPVQGTLKWLAFSIFDFPVHLFLCFPLVFSPFLHLCIRRIENYKIKVTSIPESPEKIVQTTKVVCWGRAGEVGRETEIRVDVG